MSGYTPIFRSIFQGTLCGKYPELPVWLVLLALADRHGEIDAHPSYIATVSGLPQADIEAAIKSFCQADDASRSPEEDGKRLVPIPGRGFGWFIVNHGKYREKARLAAKSEREVESGRNAERMADRRRPPETAGDRLSDSYTDSDSNPKKSEGGADAPIRSSKRTASRIPDGWKPTPDLIAYAERELPGVDVDKLAEGFTDYWRAAAGEKARKADWDATWRTWVRRSADQYPKKRTAQIPAKQIRFDANGRQISG